MHTIEGVAELTAELKRLRNEAKADAGVDVLVGYTQHYAVYVHENLESNHPNGGQAKYLEQPFRELAPELVRIVAAGLKGGLSWRDSLLMAGLRLQRESQELVPVDTGALRASAFTRVANE